MMLLRKDYGQCEDNREDEVLRQRCRRRWKLWEDGTL